MMSLRQHKEQESPQPKTWRLAELEPEARDLLNHLRLMSLQCRTAARTDLFKACAVLSCAPGVARNAHAEVLMKCLSQTLGKVPVLYRPGVDEVSFDEAWLLRAATSAARGDWDSFRFLLTSRVPRHAQRQLGFLIIRVSERFSLT